MSTGGAIVRRRKDARMQTTVSELLFSIVLPFELTNGNDGRGSKWFSSSKVRKRFESLLMCLGQRRRPFTIPVVVHVTRLYAKGQYQWDSSSIGRGNYKELEDAMVVCGWFHDDSPKYITETRFFQKRGHGKPEVQIDIFSSPEAR